MPHRRPGWNLPNGHLVRSNAEASLCEYLSGMDIGHTHWEGNFELPVSTDQLRLFIPSITLTEVKAEGAAVVIEPIDAIAPGSGLRRMHSFRKIYGSRYFVIIVARKPLHPRVPEDAYDRIFPLEDFLPLLQFLRSLSA